MLVMSIKDHIRSSGGYVRAIGCRVRVYGVNKFMGLDEG